MSSSLTIEDHFNKVMKCEKIPLLKNFEQYKKSLPVRHNSATGEHTPLYQYPYWGYDDEMDHLARQLEVYPKSRFSVKYLSAPGSSGKTSCILQGFLRSTANEDGFTHYLYMPFDNHYGCHFEVKDNDVIEDHKKPHELGASFIYQCLHSLLYQTNQYEIEPGIGGEVWKMARQVDECLRAITGPDNKHRFLIHLDEHRKMCKREKGLEDEVCKGALFSKGALGTLARVHRVTVVATYTERPPLPPQGSSGVCRSPVVKPNLNIHEARENVDELKFPTLQQVEMKRPQERMWITLHFRMAMYLLETGLIHLHDRSDAGMERLLKECKAAGELPDATEALKKLLDLCVVEVGDSDENDNATRLLLGMNEEDLEKVERHVSNLTIANGNRVTCTLMALLGMDDPNLPLYRVGAGRVLKLLRSHDYLSQTPLEAIYSWILSCRSAVRGTMNFNDQSFIIKCDDLCPGRIFPNTSTRDIDADVNWMEHNTLYYVEEEQGGPTHPLCDLFFCTKRRELVLIDVTGGNDGLVKEKMSKLAHWIEDNKGKILDKDKVAYKLHGVVLAPAATGVSKTQNNVHIVCGMEAKKIMGGLAQVFPYGFA